MRFAPILLMLPIVCLAVRAQDPADIRKRLASADPKVRAAVVAELTKIAKGKVDLETLLCDATVDQDKNVQFEAIASIEKVRPDLYIPLREFILCDQVSEEFIDRARAISRS